MSRREEIRKMRYDQIKAYKESGKSLRSWCKEQDLNYYTMRRWKEKVKESADSAIKEKEEPSFTLLTLREEKQKKEEQKETIVIRKNGFEVEIDSFHSEVFIRKALQVINRLC